MAESLSDPMATGWKRYIAIDLHKHYLMVGGIDASQRVVLPPRKLDLDRWLAWAQATLTATDAVVIEATTNAWHIYDQLLPLVGRIVVAHPPKVKQIAAARVKTDKHDVLILAQLLRADLIPEVWVPPPHVRELRALISHRQRLLRARTQGRNRLHSLIHRYNLTPPAGDLFTAKQRAWWVSLELSVTERLRVDQDLSTLDHLAKHIATVEAELHRLSTTALWANQVPYLIQLPGIGLISAMIVLSAIGEVTRFGAAQQLVGYAGLGAGVHSSGKTHRTGRITKEGRRELRWVLVEAAHTATRTHPYWQAEFRRLERRLGEKKAIVALARKLLVVIWHVLQARTADQRADAEQVAFKLMVWSWKLSDAQRGGLTSRQFIRAHLIRLGLGPELTHITRGGTRRALASVEEVLALQPELRELPAAEPPSG